MFEVNTRPEFTLSSPRETVDFEAPLKKSTKTSQIDVMAFGSSTNTPRELLFACCIMASFVDDFI